MLTDGGLETTLIFHDGLELPLFAAFTLLGSAEGRERLTLYYARYARIALRHELGFVLESPTWRASADWGAQLGYEAAALDEVNRESIALLGRIRERMEDRQPFVVSGNIGPRGDGYSPDALMSAGEAADYHDAQIASFVAAGADLVSAVTMTHAGEARGVARAAARLGIPAVLSFTVETDGRLPTGQSLGDAIAETDADTAPAYYMINCAHPDHFRDAVADGAPWTRRILGLRANASRMSHEELDNAETLDDGNPVEFGANHAELMRLLPHLRVLGGCCGTDHRHVGCVAEACRDPSEVAA
jgi:homocysteine S-methyltransferase